MRKLLLAISVAVLASLLVPAATTAHKKGPVVRAFGEGSTANFQFDFSAQSDPLGGSPRGHVTVTVQGFLFGTANVECLEVGANTAFMSGTVTETDFDPEGTLGGTFTFSAQDNGPSGQGDLVGPPIIHAPGQPGIDPATACSNRALSPPPEFPVTEGDVVVQACDRFKDKPGTAKDKCKVKKDKGTSPKPSP